MDAGYAGDEDENAGSDVRGTLKYLEAASREVSSCRERREASSQQNLPRKAQTESVPTRAQRSATSRSGDQDDYGWRHGGDELLVSAVTRRRRQRGRVAECYFGVVTGGWLGVGRYRAWVRATTSIEARGCSRSVLVRDLATTGCTVATTTESNANEK
ncbi:hypothetical protein PF005_g12222 [Phytophthora fragariae]|uniref:Uncharacterized protein n=1 Tax=Phytophthora fragariae TaxID=53985 RepID=A0A6A3XUC5_9STRA|nr:hypothetical protein PF005_g12222 [Phytophthora fragariae]